MRVIAGTKGGRTLRAPKGLSTRPTPARVRAALFSMIAGDLDAARVLDLFAGTGALGIEALSRGAANCTFVEHDRRAATALKRNLGAVGQGGEILEVDARRAIELWARRGRVFDIAFLDPPYKSDLLAPSMHALCEQGIVTRLVVCEHATRAAPPAAAAGWTLTDSRRYGDTTLSLFRPGAVAPTKETP